jgi:hypothetical protein
MKAIYPKTRFVNYDKFLIDWADEIIQDLVVSFSARRPTNSLRVAVVCLYLFAFLHLLFVALLPFDRNAIAVVIGRITSASDTQVTALATGIVVGGISFHLLMVIAYVVLSFLVRAAKPWTSALGTVVLISNCAVALNGLRGLRIIRIFALLNETFLVLAPIVIILLWCADERVASFLPRRRTAGQRLAPRPSVQQPASKRR